MIRKSKILPNLPIQISHRILTGKVIQDNHPFELKDVIHLPECLANPIAVFLSATTAGDVKVVLTEMEADGINIVVIIKPARKVKDAIVNDVRSIYPRSKIRPILEWISRNDLMEYCDKEKILKWLTKHQYNPGEVNKLLKDCTNIISKME
ncbi:MAG: hypothetical protein EOO96_23625 [Pedobacter sp.]|nr:MAG: hypothetical protein EOO96_23625 [Pedobacter sp.]